jgi:hypothetical protein
MGKSIGILQGLQSTKDTNNQSTLEDKNQSSEEKRVKRGYHLRPSTIKKLEEMKVYYYGVEASLGDIVDEAICMLYEKKKQG